MYIKGVKIPESNFFSVEKDLSIITDLILNNKRIQKLLYYTTPDAMDRPNLTEEQALSLINNNIKIVPKLTINPDIKNYIYIIFDDFKTNNTNPEFQDNVIYFHIICHYSQWQLKDFKLRPFRIAAEIKTMLEQEELTNIGDIEFVDMKHLTYSSEFMGVGMGFYAIHGGEDRKGVPNPMDEEQFIKDFNEMYNN
jgi:hypothetical protein